MLPRLLVLFTCLCLLQPLAHADQVLTFNLSGGFAAPINTDLGMPSGTVTIDTTLGTIVSINIGYTEDTQDSINPSSYVYYSGPSDYFIEFGTSWYYDPVNPAEGFVTGEDIFLPVSSLIGYTGGPICSATYGCVASNNIGGDPSTGGVVSNAVYGIGERDFTDGALTLTPEPSGLILLGTGALIPLAGWVRRRESRRYWSM